MILLPAVYSEKHLIEVSSIGIAIFIARILDIITDPLMGWICDRNFLPRKNWIVIGSILSAISLFNLIIPYQGPDAFYLCVWISFLYLGWTIFQVAYLSIGYEIERHYTERTKLSVYREVFTLFGLLSSVSLPFILSENSEFSSEKLLLYLAIISGFISVLFFSIFINEPKRKYVSIKIKNQINNLLKNKYFTKLSMAWFLNNLANIFPMILFVFYINYIIGGSESQKESALFVYFLSGLLGMPIWVFISKSYEKIRIWFFSICCSSLAFIFVFFLNSGDIFYFFIICSITGLFLGSDLAIPLSIQADITDYHRSQFKNDISGILFSVLTLITKLSFALASLIAFTILDFSGFEANQNQEAHTKFILIFLYAGVPIILKVLTAFLIRDFSLTKQDMNIITKKLYDKQF